MESSEQKAIRFYLTTSYSIRTIAGILKEPKGQIYKWIKPVLKASSDSFFYFK